MSEAIIKEYIGIVDSIYGVFLDSCQGFNSVRRSFEQSQLEAVHRNKKHEQNKTPTDRTIYNSTIEAIDSACLIYSKGNKNESDYRILHYCPTQAEYKQRNSQDGQNYRFIGNMALISL